MNERSADAVVLAVGSAARMAAGRLVDQVGATVGPWSLAYRVLGFETEYPFDGPHGG